MNFWPANKKGLKRLVLFSLLGYLPIIILLNQVFLRFKSLNRLFSSPTQSFPRRDKSGIEPQTFICPQKVDQSGWTINNGLIRTFPQCLTVMNSKFGSRFNFDWFFSKQIVKSSLLGSLEDQDIYLSLNIADHEEKEQIFPLLNNSPVYNVSNDLGLTFQKINFDKENILLSLNINAPFAPSHSAEDENVKMSSAPFFYLDITLKNKTPLKQKKTLSLSLGNAKNKTSKDGFDILYLNSRAETFGSQAIAYSNIQNGLISSIHKGQAVINWEANLDPYSSSSINLIYAGFFDNTVIVDSSREEKRNLKFAYNKWFNNVEEVIEFAEQNRNDFLNKTNRFEQKIQNQNLSPQIKWLLAQAFHSYMGNTWLVYDEKTPDDFEYYVWEGEFKYLNTVDVAHDYGVLEGLYFPWVLKLELDSWRKNVKQEEKGIVIPHDLGRRFEIEGVQAFKTEGWQTSGMPVEENVNFILLSYWYWKQTQDDQFLKDSSEFIKKLVSSLINRDTNNNGIADTDIGITTYDNDGNLALYKGPDNTYLGIKQLSAYISAKEIFQLAGNKSGDELVTKQIQLISDSLKKAHKDYGYIPLSINPSFKEEQAFPFIIGLFYPALSNLDSPYLDELLPILTKSYPSVYEKSLVKNAKGEIMGLQLAEYQNGNLGWFSHSVMADYIAEKLLGLNYASEEIFFPLIYDSAFAFTDGYTFREPFYPPKSCLLFYPRGAALFANLQKN